MSGCLTDQLTGSADAGITVRRFLTGRRHTTGSQRVNGLKHGAYGKPCQLHINTDVVTKIVVQSTISTLFTRRQTMDQGSFFLYCLLRPRTHTRRSRDCVGRKRYASWQLRFFLFLFFIPASRMSLPHYQIWDFPHQAGSRAVFYRPSIEGKERGYIHVRFEGPGGDAHLLHASGILTACTTARLHSVSFHERRGFSQVFFFS